MQTKLNVFMIIFSLLACAHKQQANPVSTANSARPQTQKSAVELDHHVVSSLAFRAGQQTLTPQAAALIDRAMDEAKARGNIEQVEVAVWSDQEYPGKSHRLPPQQVQLAQERAKNIKDYVQHLQPGVNINVHNMAEQPSALANLLNTPDADLKKKLVTLGIAPTSDQESVIGRSATALMFVRVK